MAATSPSLENCLAYQVLLQPDRWIVDPSVHNLDAFLSGVSTRAALMLPGLPEWRISGVLQQEGFYLPLVARTGHPSLTIRWATAIEILYQSQAEGFAALRSEFTSWHAAHGFPIDTVGSLPWSPAEFWKSFARRPGMYMGASDGWRFYCFLNGMSAGGDWLELPKMPGLDPLFEELKERSTFLYGTEFATFRINDTPSLLKNIGMLPEQNDE